MSQGTELLTSILQRLAAEVPARRVPSWPECRFCVITAADCPERVEAGPQHEGETTDDF